MNIVLLNLALSRLHLVFCILKAGVSNKAKPRIIEYRSYENFDVNKFKNDLRNVPWHVIDNENNVDNGAQKLDVLVKKVYFCH